MPLFDNLKNIPQSPGVYFFKNKTGVILYIGKAKNLKNRLTQYRDGQTTSSHTPNMLEQAMKIDYVVASSEVESLIWEKNLIKAHLPKYNIRLRDDKNYLYIQITNEPFPKITTTRQPNLQLGKCFGPFTNSEYAQNTLKTIRRAFPYRTCNILPKKPCLYFSLLLCPAPCINNISEHDYANRIKEIIQILNNKNSEIVKKLESEMQKNSDEKKYEQAAIIRDQIRALTSMSKNNVSQSDEDAFSIIKQDNLAAVHLFVIRQQKLIRTESFLFDQVQNNTESDILESLALNYYEFADLLPKKIITTHAPSNQDLILKWFAEKIKKNNIKQSIPKFQIPQKGKDFKLLKTGLRNAQEKINWHKLTQINNIDKKAIALKNIQIKLNLPTLPCIIECYDISNIQGKYAVGSMVVFENGIPKKSAYRHFTIKSINNSNDPAMMKEVISRRLKHSEWATPDLILLDGGLPQLNAIKKLFRDKKITIPLASLAKKEEVIYTLNHAHPIHLPKNSDVLHIFQAIRDEAHRFAITHFKKRFKKISFQSSLDNIPNIGKKSKQLLIKAFGSIDIIKNIPEFELVKMLGKKRAQDLIKYFKTL